MFHLIASVAGIAITVIATAIGYWQARQFTTHKLRYVDAVHRASVPLLVGIGAALIVTPIVWVLPLVGTGTAVLFGAGVGTGVAAGAKEIRKRLPA